MSVTIKSAHEIELMREAGRLLNIVHKELEAAIRPGISTWELDKLGERVIRGFGCVPNFLNYNGFPASFCISVNDEVVHGIPSKEKILHEGDIVSIDAGLIYKGMHSDAARTYGVGQISPEAQKLIDVTRESFSRELNWQKMETTFIRSQQPSVITQNPLATVLSVIWLAMVSAMHYTRIRRFRISARETEAFVL